MARVDLLTYQNAQLYVFREYAISSNRALNGGGIYANKSIFSIGHITTMTNNSAARDGGALYLTDDSEIRFSFHSSIITYT